jgi:hypothetical protein
MSKVEKIQVVAFSTVFLSVVAVVSMFIVVNVK